MQIALAVGALGLLMMAVEAARPGRAWPRVPGWWPRALAANAVQAAIVFLAGATWDAWFRAHAGWPGHQLGLVPAALLGYVAVTFVYYWWHRARHEVPLLWRWFHQLHHSPARLEVLTSFYKHPLEIAANGVLSSAILYLGLGLAPEAAALAIFLTGIAELFYHWNVRTPHWLGYWIQRPESHCVHHQAGLHAYNYGDLPLWDALFGTLRNPREWDASCGFGEAEHRAAEMLRGVDVLAEAPPARPAAERGWWIAALLLVLGTVRMGADLAGAPLLASAAAATGASPAPKVFSAVEGLETYSSRFYVEWTDAAGASHAVELTPERYARLSGPYNRRNVYGAALAYGPVLASNDATRPIQAAALRFAVCGDAPLLTELGIDALDRTGPVRIRVVPQHRPADATWPEILEEDCR